MALGHLHPLHANSTYEKIDNLKIANRIPYFHNFMDENINKINYALQTLNMFRSAHSAVMSESALSMLFEKQNLQIQKQIKNFIFELLYKFKYYYSTLLIILRKSNQNNIEFPFLDSFSNFSYPIKVNDKVFDTSQLWDLVCDHHRLQELLCNRNNDEKQKLCQLITYVIIPKQFHYFLLESDYPRFVAYMQSIQDPNLVQRFAFSAFHSSLFHSFIQKTFTPHLRELLISKNQITMNEHEIKSIIKRIKYSLYKHRSECPVFIVELLNKCPRLFADCFINKMSGHPFLFGLVEYYEKANTNLPIYTAFKNSAEEFVQIIILPKTFQLIDKKIDQILTDLHTNNITKKQITDLITFCTNLKKNTGLDIDEFNDIIQTANALNTNRDKIQILKALQAKVRKLDRGSSCPFFTYDSENLKIIANAFETEFYDIFDEEFDALVNKRKYKMSKEYTMKYYSNDTPIPRTNDKTIIPNPPLRQLIKLIPVFPVFTKLPKPLAPNMQRMGPKYFHLVPLLQNLLQTVPREQFFLGLQCLEKIKTDPSLSPFLGLVDEKSNKYIQSQLESMHYKHENNKIELIQFNNVYKSTSDLQTDVNTIIRESCGYRNILFVKDKVDPVLKQIEQAIDKKNQLFIDPIENPSILFRENGFYQQILRSMKYLPTERQETKELCLHYTYKFISFDDFIAKRQEVQAQDYYFNYCIKTNIYSLMKKIENEIVHKFSIQTKQLFLDVFENPIQLEEMKKQAIVLSSILKQNADPLQKSNNFDIFYHRFYQFFLDTNQILSLIDLFFKYFLLYFNPSDLLTNAIYLEEYFFNSSSDYFQYYFQQKKLLPPLYSTSIFDKLSNGTYVYSLILFVQEYSLSLCNKSIISLIRSKEKHIECVFHGSGEFFESCFEKIFGFPFSWLKTSEKQEILKHSFVYNDDFSVVMNVIISSTLKPSSKQSHYHIYFVSHQNEIEEALKHGSLIFYQNKRTISNHTDPKLHEVTDHSDFDKFFTQLL